ncbi:hypothetical protein [Anaerotignum propionicum]|uniref:DUF3298 domain-containing protein n=1 Tax=Anaerotignum propionicum DSM 1682 TaxID=991789 RepID=A0A110A769_ANAPI|nr:hypothetical protein [Anaerotignum propionicum]AMJ41675.1 hypothetical protein CPRO_20940 [Anaerotignum propionicum DSM 1682]SHE88823.1 hypothetical protein SAMN02745151_02115 [[Clostridium] propionicum DSM 1682] [Anaerotignum propionicum DSM 1682]
MKENKVTLIVLISCVLLFGCGSDSKKEAELLTLKQENVYLFKDGSNVNLWRMERIGRDVYKLSDGTILLMVAEPSVPVEENQEGIKNSSSLYLSEKVQKAVSTFYQKQGLLYDIQGELEKAYTYYLSCKKTGKTFDHFFISQDSFFSCTSNNIVCFDTSVTLVRENREAQDILLSAIFDKSTGEQLSIWDLFVYSQSESKKRLLNALKIDDKVLLTEMEKTFKDEYIFLSPNGLVISFPEGALPSENASLSVKIEYIDLQGILQSWAIPHPGKKG